jgi:ribosome production factor 2
MIRPKPKTSAGKRFLEKRQPMLVEDAKTCVFLKGTTCSSIVSDALKDMACLKKPDCVLFTKKNDIHPFDDYKPLEFLSLKNDAAFFVFGNHSKKRPHNMVIARMFDNQILDMIELGITDISFMDEFKGPKPAVGNRPLILFVGDSWLSSLELIHVKSMLLDLYSGNRSNDQIDLNGLSHVITFTAKIDHDKPIVIQRTYTIRLKKTGTKEPAVELEECGPHFDFELRRTLPANPDTLKQSLKIPKELKVQFFDLAQKDKERRIK